MQRQCLCPPCGEQCTHSGGSARANRGNGTAVGPWNPQPCRQRGAPLPGKPRAPRQSPLQGPGHPSRERCPGAVPAGSVLLPTPPGSVGRGSSSWQQRRAGAGEPSTGPSAAWRGKKGQIRDQAATSPLARPWPLPAPAQVDVRPLHGGQPGQQWLQVTRTGHVVVESLWKQKVG